MEKHESNLEKVQESIYGKDSTKKIPKFIAQMREEKKKIDSYFENKSFGSP
jgi:hypothetical protein